MRVVLLVVAGILVFAAAWGAAQTQGRVTLTADVGGVTCNIEDVAPLVYVHMLVTERADVAAVHFAAPKPSCWVGATWLGDNISFPVVIGDSQNNYIYGLSIAFGDCLDSPIYLGAIVYWTQGQALPCCWYPVVKTDDGYPNIPTPVMSTCDYRAAGINAGSAVINAQPECSCDEPVAVEEATWGAVKALYQ